MQWASQDLVRGNRSVHRWPVPWRAASQMVMREGNSTGMLRHVPGKRGWDRWGLGSPRLRLRPPTCWPLLRLPPPFQPVPRMLLSLFTLIESHGRPVATQRRLEPHSAERSSSVRDTMYFRGCQERTSSSTPCGLALAHGWSLRRPKVSVFFSLSCRL